MPTALDANPEYEYGIDDDLELVPHPHPGPDRLPLNLASEQMWVLSLGSSDGNGDQGRAIRTGPSARAATHCRWNSLPGATSGRRSG
jgi:hypothetical protein